MTDTAHYIEKAGSVRNAGERGRLKKQAFRFLRYREREERRDELKGISETLSPANIAAQKITSEGRASLSKRRRYLEDELENLSPPDKIDGIDAVVAERKRLEEKIRLGMPSEEEMWRNPAGAVDRHKAWEKANKDDILKWKNLKILEEPENDGPNLCNVELLRPSAMQPGGAATYMANSQLPGNFAMTPQAKENWPLGEPKIDTALKQVERREEEELKAKLLAAEQELAELRMKAEKRRRAGQENIKKAIAARKKKKEREMAKFLKTPVEPAEASD